MILTRRARLLMFKRYHFRFLKEAKCHGELFSEIDSAQSTAEAHLRGGRAAG